MVRTHGQHGHRPRRDTPPCRHGRGPWRCGSPFQTAHTLATDTNDLGILHVLLHRMAERLGRRLRERGLAAGRLAVAIDYADAASAARAVAVREAALDVELWDAADKARQVLLGRKSSAGTARQVPLGR